MRLRVGAGLDAAWRSACRDWDAAGSTSRLFARDATLWTGTDESDWLGWLGAPEAARTAASTWDEIAADGRGFEHVLLLGMGGSSLAPELQRAAFGRIPGHPRLHVLDSIHPLQVARFEASLDLGSTLVVVASKSGSTLEPNLLLAHFRARLAAELGDDEAARRIVAITDPGSALERRAKEEGFRRVVLGEPSIGGRFSALSPFGLVPAALQGIDLAAWIGSAESMAETCRRDDAAENPGAGLGLALAAAALQGRDKLTLVLPPGLELLGSWLEQLVAESTGKQGRAILPFEGEPLGEPAAYGDDRLFVAIRRSGERWEALDEALEGLATVGQPLIEIDLGGPHDLAGELYRWEIATAVAGARLGVNPFDQPDVEAAKVAARRLAARVEADGALPEEEPLVDDGRFALFAPETQRRALLAGAGPVRGVESVLRAHLRRLGRGDYFALLAFCAMSDEAGEAATRLRRAVRDGFGVATSVGFGPRYLHSTGQAHKGGPPSGLFVVVSDRPEADLPVPGQPLTFGQATRVQALGDFEVLAERGRRALRIELRGPGDDLLPELASLVERLSAPA